MTWLIGGGDPKTPSGSERKAGYIVTVNVGTVTLTINGEPIKSWTTSDNLTGEIDIYKDQEYALIGDGELTLLKF